MRGFRSLLVVVLLSFFLPCLTPRAHAQQTVPQQVSSGTQAVALNGPWKFRTGDSPKSGAGQTPLWAQPNYDDSGWQDYTIDPKQSKLTAVQVLQAKELPGWQQYGHPGYTGYAWYRIRLQIEPGAHSLALLMPRHVEDAYEVYLNGTKIGSFGKLNGWHVLYPPQPKLFSIPAAALSSGQPITLAIRFWNRRYEALPSLRNRGGGLRGVPLLGSSTLLYVFQQSQREQATKISLRDWVLMALYGSVGVLCLFLFFFSHDQREYLWAGIALIGFSVYLACFELAPQTNIPVQLALVAQDAAIWAAFIAMPFAAMHLLSVPKLLWRRISYLAMVLLFGIILLDIGLNLGLLPAASGIDRTGSMSWLTMNYAILFLLLAITVDGIRTIGRKAWLLLTPGVLFVGAIVLYWWGYTAGRFAVIDNLLTAGVPVSVLIIFLMRFTEQQRENVRLVGDMRQAQTVQQMLIPLAAPSTPGFNIESVYLPASEVGGDFFQILPGNDGSLLIVVGDVSGKGLKAAMTVSTIVGALRGCSLRDPADVLAYLNRVLHGQIKGFVTCCAALITANGAMSVASAGHPPPYRNGAEMGVAGALPLGIVSDGSYEESQFQLSPDDRLTFVSDGVVEATNPKRELFGFERTQRISSESATHIAETAKQFGQEDDITVVSVRYLGIARMTPVVPTANAVSAAAAG